MSAGLKHAAFLSVALAGMLALAAISASSLTAKQEAKLVASDGEAHDFFGHSVALDGDTTVIGAYRDDDNGPYSGSAYVFVRTAGAWLEQAKLLPADGATHDLFGGRVALDGDTTLVGTGHDRGNGPNSGSAYVFTRVGGIWTEQAKLLADDGAQYDVFGFSVALDGDTAFVGAPSAGRFGSVYVFTRSDGVWTQHAKLEPSSSFSLAEFGVSVAIDDDTAVIGARRDSVNATNSGSAYVFTRTDGVWTEQAKLAPTDGGLSEYFGWSVAVDDDTAVIGANNDDDNGGSSGSAYVFTRTAGGWAQQIKLLPGDGVNWHNFGQSVAVEGDTAVIGAPGDDDNGSRSGAAYVFTRTENAWVQQVKLLADDGERNDRLGYAVTMDGDTVVVGANEDDAYLTGSGSAYVFRLGPPDEDGDGVEDEVDLCSGTIIPESVPTSRLGVNRWALIDEDGIFDTKLPRGRGNGPGFEFSIEDTAGCSCEQIVEQKALGWGHTRFGCSTGVLLQWIASAGAVNPAR